MLAYFRGGIHPPENKGLTEEKEIKNLSVPHECYISLQQHIGAPAQSIVAPGDHVIEGQLIGESLGFISSNIHASVPGKVVDIREIPTVYNMQKAIIIEAEGSFAASTKREAVNSWQDMGREEILQKISGAGIVGLGGAAFPTAVKLSPPPEKNIDILIINGAECEPYLTVDDALMRSCPDEIIEGIQITLKVLGIKSAIIGIEDNKKNAVVRLQQKINETVPEEDINAVALKTKYPQGAEKQLIFALLKREVPSGKLPMDIGVVVQNVGTVFAIREAVLYDKPLFERAITVSGSMINRPGNYKVRIGTMISDVVEECGGLKGAPAKVVMGGPMCGISIPTLDVPVVKGTSGILFLSEDETGRGDFSQCIRCGKCVSVCPMGLVPCDLSAAVQRGRFDLAGKLHPYDCIMCGSCAYSCPSKRPISHFIKIAQRRLRDK